MRIAAQTRIFNEFSSPEQYSEIPKSLLIFSHSTDSDYPEWAFYDFEFLGKMLKKNENFYKFYYERIFSVSERTITVPRSKYDESEYKKIPLTKNLDAPVLLAIQFNPQLYFKGIIDKKAAEGPNKVLMAAYALAYLDSETLPDYPYPEGLFTDKAALGLILSKNHKIFNALKKKNAALENIDFLKGIIYKNPDALKGIPNELKDSQKLHDFYIDLILNKYPALITNLSSSLQSNLEFIKKIFADGKLSNMAFRNLKMEVLSDVSFMTYLLNQNENYWHFFKDEIKTTENIAYWLKMVPKLTNLPELRVEKYKDAYKMALIEDHTILKGNPLHHELTYEDILEIAGQNPLFFNHYASARILNTPKGCVKYFSSLLLQNAHHSLSKDRTPSLTHLAKNAIIDLHSYLTSSDPKYKIKPETLAQFMIEPLYSEIIEHSYQMLRDKKTEFDKTRLMSIEPYNTTENKMPIEQLGDFLDPKDSAPRDKEVFVENIFSIFKMFHQSRFIKPRENWTELLITPTEGSTALSKEALQEFKKTGELGEEHTPWYR